MSLLYMVSEKILSFLQEHWLWFAVGGGLFLIMLLFILLLKFCWWNKRGKTHKGKLSDKNNDKRIDQ